MEISPLFGQYEMHNTAKLCLFCGLIRFQMASASQLTLYCAEPVDDTEYKYCDPPRTTKFKIPIPGSIKIFL